MTSFRSALLLASLSLLNQLASATPSHSTTQACQAIDAALPGQLSYPLELKYVAETQKYWSTALRDLVPACVVLPTSTANVATIVQILNTYPDVDFAVKSGGHDVNPGHGSIQDGILIALRQISGATYDGNTGLAYVKPGGEWNDVIGDLAPYDVTVVGGRLGWCPSIHGLAKLRCAELTRVHQELWGLADTCYKVESRFSLHSMVLLPM